MALRFSRFPLGSMTTIHHNHHPKNKCFLGLINRNLRRSASSFSPYRSFSCPLSVSDRGGIRNPDVDYVEPFYPNKNSHWAAYRRYMDCVDASEGFDVGDDNYGRYLAGGIQKWDGPFDYDAITKPALFAVGEHNAREVNAQAVQGFMFYLTLEVTDAGEKKIYQAKVWRDVLKSELLLFRLANDAPTNLVTKQDGGILRNPVADYVEPSYPNEQFSPEEYYRYMDCVVASEGFDVGDDSYGRYIEGGIHKFNGPLDFDAITEPALFAVCEHNARENANLIFVKVLKANVATTVQGYMFYITLEVTDAGEKKTYQAKVWRDVHRSELHLFRLTNEVTPPQT